MATYISLINSVLTRLRESNVATPGASKYSLLIGEFVNEAKREVEDAWKWTALRQSISITLDNTQAASTPYTMTGSGRRFKFLDKDREMYNSTDEYVVSRRDSIYIKNTALRHQKNGDTGQVSYFYLQGVDANGDAQVFFDIKTDANDLVIARVIVPQDDFSVGTEVLSIPEWPVIQGAYLRALAERGEDQGRTHGEVINNYNTALADAIAIDEALTIGETTWYV